MSLVIWTYIFGGASLFGFIVGVFSVWNGRMTRREISHFIDSSTAQTREILTAIQQTQGGIEKTLARMEALLQRHATALERLAPR